jgi:hypothetical protein
LTARSATTSFGLAAEVDFDHLLLDHGPPIVGDGRERLRAFAAPA